MVKTIVSFIMSIIAAFNVFGGVKDVSGYVGDFFKDQGVLGYLYNEDGRYFYTSPNAWQGVFGFNDLYDEVAPFVVMFYDTVQFNFNYDDEDWRIQLWKGQYGWVFIGGEIGVYTKPERRVIGQYDRADKEDWLKMSFKLTRFGFWDMFETEHNEGWWCTGFVPGSLVILSWRSQLKMDACITAKDAEMLEAFTQSISEAGYSYTVDGLDVSLTF